MLEDYLRNNCDAPVIVSPDAGRIKVAERMAQHLDDCGADLAFCYKRRPKGTTNVAEATPLFNLLLASHVKGMGGRLGRGGGST